MEFNPNNLVVKLCAEGIALEGKGALKEAGGLYTKAWHVAVTGFEKFTAAHYIARIQTSIADKLRWDETALQWALLINGETVKSALPSLYLNIGKCYEDMADIDTAREKYQAAFSYMHYLPDDGYGNMIRAGINNGLDRVG